ncbi:MAG: hypothetical protein EHM24_00120 [Acidobacteria bacterium]|nr:MAG: hypothetical protein EHM24_09925 [Acidobacteriota bacterium]RPJ77416.1 MAG: hypothetical protein EHM24_00120 [Acidobacteriota bacterium]
MAQTRILVLAAAILLVWDARAEAYLDPGSGSMLVQLLLGGVAGLAVLLNLFWKRLLERFGRGREHGAGRSDRA